MPLRFLAATLVFLTAMTVRAESLYEIALKDIDGHATTLASYRGRVLFIVNVASACGYTPQYQGLQAAFANYEKRGFTVLGFPCNQFGGQESGSNAEIKEFCSTNFHVAFPLFDKIEVNGAHRHPLYVALAGKGSLFPGDIKWNFTKFLVGRDGTVLQRFGSDAEPESPEVIKAIEAALAAK
jgi:glutathione peroxidase